MKRLILILSLVFLSDILSGKDNPPVYSLFEKDNRIGLADTKGNILIPPDYEDLGWSGGSLEIVRDRIGYRENGLWGILNLGNKKITPPQYISLFPCENEQLIASVPDQYKLAELFGIINIEGRPVSGFHYNSLSEAGDYFIGGTRKSGIARFGVIRSNGEVIIPFKYAGITSTGRELFACMDESKRIRLYSASGKSLTNDMYDDVIPFKSGYADISIQGKHGLIDETGRVILKTEHKEIEIGNSGIIRYMPYNEWHIFGNEGENILKLSYDSLIPVSSDRLIALAENNFKIISPNDSCLGSFPGLRIVKIYKNSLVVGEKHKQGLISLDGKFVYPMIYDSIVCRDDYALLHARHESETGWMMGNLEGEILNYGLYESLVPINRGNILARRKGFWGILNNRGEEKINCIYDTICYNENGLIKVVFHRENGLLWKNRWFIYPGPMQISVMQDDRILVSGYFGSIILNILGDTLYQTEHIIVPEGKFFRVRNREGKFGLLDKDYNTLLYPLGNHITHYDEDSLFIFKSDEGWGAVNSMGKTLFYDLADIDSILSFSEGYFRVLIDRNYGFIDVNGKLRIANRYAEAMDFVNGIAPVKVLGRWGFISKNEKFLIQPFYDDVFSRQNGFIIIRRGAGSGIINNQGETVQDEEYQAISPQPSGGFLCLKNGLFGYINTRGSLTVIPRYDDIQVLSNGNLIVSRNSKFGMLSGTGETILPVIYDGLYEDQVLQCMIGLIRSNWRDL